MRYIAHVTLEQLLTYIYTGTVKFGHMFAILEGEIQEIDAEMEAQWVFSPLLPKNKEYLFGEVIFYKKNIYLNV